MAVRLRMLAGALVCASALTTAATLPASSVGAQVKTISGPVTAVGNGWVTVQTAGRRTGVINALTASANKITSQDYPYVWGGGHAEAGVASVGERGGNGFNGKTHGYDCSGAVAAALAGAGLWAPGSSVPRDDYVISELMSEHLIARGVAPSATGVTLYDDPGVHIFMNINGRFFGTSDGGGGGGNGRGGAGWLSDGAFDASDKAYKKYHFVPSVLKQSTSYGNNFTFQLSNLLAGTENVTLGDTVSVAYTPQSSGTLLAGTVTWKGATTTTGQVTQITATGLRITTPSGQLLSYAAKNADFLLVDLLVGDTVSVLSTPGRNGANPTAHQVTVTAQPVPTTTTTTPTTTTPTGTTTTGTATTPPTGTTPTQTTPAPTPPVSSGPSTTWTGPGGYGHTSHAVASATAAG